MAQKKVDLVIIGAGWNGLSAAKTYIQLNPSAEVIIYDSESTLGGVWNKASLYPGLKSNNLIGTIYEFSDYPMDAETYGVKLGEHIPGLVIHRYLNNFAEHFGVFKRIQFRSKVETAEHDEAGGWLLTVSKVLEDSSTTEKTQVFASKIIVATGLTSTPSVAKFKGSESFDAPLFHPKHFLQHVSALETAERVCVLGGHKSAWDAVYEFASKGVEVEWIIRKSGHGPVWMSPAYVTPLKRLLEGLVHTRLLTWFSPCIWGDADGYVGIRKFLHGSRIGRSIVNAFWSIIGNDVITLNKFASHPETAKLQPWSNPMFIGAGLSILNYKTDFFQLVKDGLIHVHIEDIEYLSPKTVHLSNGQKLEVDALVSCTGWKHSPPLTFLPSTLDLGLPHPRSPQDPQELIQKADEEIFSRFPRLLDQPKPNPHAKTAPVKESEEHLTSWNLYRFMIPPSTTTHRDIAFAGCLTTVFTTMIAQVQALWICAYFSNDHPLALPNAKALAYETVLHNRFGKWRYPAGFGALVPDFVFDAVPYVDLLLGDLGLKKKRKEGVTKELLEPYGPKEYQGLVEEWVESKK